MKIQIEKFVCEGFERNRDKWHSCKNETCSLSPLYHYYEYGTYHIWVDRISIRKELPELIASHPELFATFPVVLHSDYARKTIADQAEDESLQQDILDARFCVACLDFEERIVNERSA